MKTKTLLELIQSVSKADTFQDVLTNLYEVDLNISNFYNTELDEVMRRLALQEEDVILDILAELANAFVNFDHKCTPHYPFTYFMTNDTIVKSMGQMPWQVGDKMFDHIIKMESTILVLWCIAHEKLDGHQVEYHLDETTYTTTATEMNLRSLMKEFLIDELNGYNRVWTMIKDIVRYKVPCDAGIKISEVKAVRKDKKFMRSVYPNSRFIAPSGDNDVDFAYKGVDKK